MRASKWNDSHRDIAAAAANNDEQQEEMMLVFFQEMWQISLCKRVIPTQSYRDYSTLKKPQMKVTVKTGIHY